MLVVLGCGSTTYYPALHGYGLGFCVVSFPSDRLACWKGANKCNEIKFRLFMHIWLRNRVVWFARTLLAIVVREVVREALIDAFSLMWR